MIISCEKMQDERRLWRFLKWQQSMFFDSCHMTEENVVGSVYIFDFSINITVLYCTVLYCTVLPVKNPAGPQVPTQFPSLPNTDTQYLKFYWFFTDITCKIRLISPIQYRYLQYPPYRYRYASVPAFLTDTVSYRFDWSHCLPQPCDTGQTNWLSFGKALGQIGTYSIS